MGLLPLPEGLNILHWLTPVWGVGEPTLTAGDTDAGLPRETVIFELSTMDVIEDKVWGRTIFWVEGWLVEKRGLARRVWTCVAWGPVWMIRIGPCVTWPASLTVGILVAPVFGEFITEDSCCPCWLFVFCTGLVWFTIKYLVPLLGNRTVWCTEVAVQGLPIVVWTFCGLILEQNWNQNCSFVLCFLFLFWSWLEKLLLNVCLFLH